MNAAQSLDHGGHVRIVDTSNEKEVRLAISDDGPGIKKENLAHIFDPFFTTKAYGHGTGLGLSISYGIVQAHGGSILVDSGEGKGANFTLVFPRTA